MNKVLTVGQDSSQDQHYLLLFPAGENFYSTLSLWTCTHQQDVWPLLLLLETLAVL